MRFGGQAFVAPPGKEMSEDMLDDVTRTVVGKADAHGVLDDLFEICLDTTLLAGMVGGTDSVDRSQQFCGGDATNGNGCRFDHLLFGAFLTHQLAGNTQFLFISKQGCLRILV